MIETGQDKEIPFKYVYGRMANCLSAGVILEARILKLKFHIFKQRKGKNTLAK